MSKKKKLKIGVIFGGRSGEHEVSIVSAQSVIKTLDKKKYEVIPIGITKDGLGVAKNPVQALKSGKKIKGTRLMPEDLLKRLDVIFPVLHGPYGEDGTIQGMLELANLPYVGAGVLGSALAMDKVIQKQLCNAAGLQSVPFDWFLAKDWKKNQNAILNRLGKTLKYPMFVKPANMGSSVGISKAENKKELIKGINDAIQYDRKILIEQGIENIYEIEIAVLGNDDPEASVLGEIIPSGEFYDYDAKYVDGKTKEIANTKALPKNVVKKIQHMAIEAFKAVNLSGMARIDFIVTKKGHKIYLNEINTIPGFTSISMFPKLWQASGLSYSQLIDKLIELAIERHKEKNQLSTEFKPKEDWYK
ncbi:MAG: D-alanine--D-alanine ligase [Bacteroidetes bacterium]|nr:D-alanine--D-alanine ligase [Bacteroidota bacterium]